MGDRSLICVTVMRVIKLNICIWLWIPSRHVFHINNLSMSKAVMSSAQTFTCWQVLAVTITAPLITRLKNNTRSFISDFKGGGCLHFLKCVCMCRYVRIDLCVYIAGDSRRTNTKVVHDVKGTCEQKKFKYTGAQSWTLRELLKALK